MKRGNLFKRLLCLFMVVAMLAAYAVPVSAEEAASVTFEQVDNSAVSATIPGREPVELPEEEAPYGENEVVRVSIVLEKAGTIEAGYSTTNIAINSAAKRYRSGLEKDQTDLVGKIEKAIKEDLDVVWNLTLAANIISANVKFGQIEEIENIAGVKCVVIETQYLPDVVQTNEAADPNMATSGAQIGSAAAWAGGYTGAGSRIAVIDTGTDTDHQSMNAAAFEYALECNANKAGMTVEEYMANLDLLDTDEIAGVLEELNAYKRLAEYGYALQASDLYINSKLPFGFNYVDENLIVNHDYDSQGSHGSHVAGIAAANAYIPSGDGFVSALESVFVQGVAPDAQLITMKVFGANGGAYDSDYMAAIEDAIVLGCDAVNLSLGSGNPGMSNAGGTTEQPELYQNIMESLEGSGVVVAMSSGNSGYWAESAENGLPYLYLDDVSMQTDGSPGSFTNSFTVASVDNDGFTATYFAIGESIISYAESAEYGNPPMTTIGGTHEYVFVNALGKPEDFAALGEGALEGKIALCYRGETSFFEKANAAVEAGAKGVIIVNNQEGVIYLNLTDYKYGAPVVSITLADGELFKENGTENTTESGLTYWTGTMEISDSLTAGQYNSEYYTMSSFSSWGVPGSLELKPEITAPGGSIYSINGVAVDGVSYEVMSGTSMASPQVAGMAAVMAQYVRENGLAEKSGLDERTLIQSLLMSTAVPLRDGASGGNYYPVIQQGAGLANVGAATMADSYIMMGSNATKSYADGKVKAELGDDPDRNGVYSFSFTINNLTNVEKTFALSADVFTQDAFDYSGIMFMDTWTANLGASIHWTVNGKSVESGADLNGLDFNGDGVVNTDDGQALLDYATGVRGELTNLDKADLNGDGKVNSYDAYLFLTKLSTSGAVVPANGSAKVTVTIALSEDDKAYLDAYYTSGAYIQAYVYAESLSSAEGVEGTTHSIPMLAFYGNWSDASMFDKGSAIEYYVTGTENRPPYLYASNLAAGKTNGLTISYGGDPNEYWFGGNPMVTDPVYYPERNAISGVDGSAIMSLGFAAIRNAAASYFTVSLAETGDLLMAQPLGAVNSAFYYVNGGYWSNTYYNLGLGLTMDGIPENMTLEMALTLVPEYYVDDEGNVDLSALGKGTTFSMPMTIDNTAPTLDDIALNLVRNTLEVTVTDNQYVAAVALFDSYGQHLYTYEGSKADAEANTTVKYSLDMTNVNGRKFLLQIYDYAMNTTTFEITNRIGEVTDKIESVELNKTAVVMQKGTSDSLTAIVYPVNAIDRDVVWTSSDDSVVAVDENGVITAVGAGNASVIATASGDESVSASCEVTVIDIDVDMNAIVWDEAGSIWYSQFNTTELPDYTKLSHDMLEDDYIVSSCVGPNGEIYASSLNTSTGTGAIYSIDPVTYEVTFMSDCIVQGLHIFYSDLTYVPGMFGTGMLLGTYGPYVMVIDPATGTTLAIIDEYDSDLVGITTCYGMYDPEMGVYQDVVYLIQNDGTIIQEIYYGYDYMVVPYMYYVYGERASFNSGVSVGDAWYFNSAYYDGNYLYWSAFNQQTQNQVTLYAIDADYSGSVYTVGKFADSVWPVGGLHQNYFINDAEAAAAKLAEVHADVTAKGMPEVTEIQLVAKDFPVKEVKVGSLNSVANYVAPVRPMSATEVGTSEDTVVVTVTAKDAEGAIYTNGVSTVTYDAESLVLKSIEVEGDYTSVKKADGTVTFGYVDFEGIAAGETVATLVFEVKSTDAESVTVTHEETNADDTASDEVVEIVYPHANTEVRDAKEATCTEDGYTGDTYCTDCGTLLAKGEVIPATGHTAEVVPGKAPTCTEPGLTDGEKCSVCGETLTAQEEIPAAGHDYESTVTKPTRTEKGYTTHTCKVCGHSYVDSYTDPIPDGSANTGDAFSTVWVLLMMVSMAGAAMLVLNRKKFLVK